MSKINQIFIEEQLKEFEYRFRDGLDFNEDQLLEIVTVCQQIIEIAEERMDGVTC